MRKDALKTLKEWKGLRNKDSRWGEGEKRLMMREREKKIVGFTRSQVRGVREGGKEDKGERNQSSL